MPARARTNNTFAARLLRWFRQHGRHDLPWQQNPTPYRVWVSEIMLQQTQVATVIPYFLRFMQRFPDVATLAAANVDQVLHLWTGLGYYARARNLHRAAQCVVSDHGGQLPTSVDALASLPGIGPSTAGAIAALAMNIRAPILDGNVKRVLTRFHAIAGYPEQHRVKAQLWQLAESLTPAREFAAYTQAIMDLGATVCTRANPQCTACPVRTDCKALAAGKTTSYPGKKPKKNLPVKAVTMFILQNQQGEVLLEKRPATGIWGSLYSLPESESPDTVTELHRFRLPKKSREQLAPIRHSFSHYHLQINPVRVAVKSRAGGVAEQANWLWYPLDQKSQQSLHIGLAAPVKKLLAFLTQTAAKPTRRR